MNENFSEYGYRTGSTQPPKSKRGPLAFLLIMVILLCGIISVLSFLNVRLFRQIAEESKEEDSFRFSLESPTTPTDTASTEPTPIKEDTDVTVHLNQSPESVDNIPQAGGLSLQDIYSKAIPSVVSITCVTDGGSSTGSGVVLSPDGYIVTNAHVVDSARTLEVLLSDGTFHAARIVGTDSFSDLAVLSINATGLQAAEFGDDQSLRVGDAVVAIGDPLGIELRGTMTNGIISAINRDVQSEGRTMTLIQTNAALNQGNSGGPLLNCYGQVIGINTMKMGDNMSAAGVEGLGFAIPSNTIKEVVDQLLSQGYVSGRPSLGFTVQRLSTFDQLYYGIPQGLYITSVSPVSNASKIGILQGDVLLSFNGQPTADTETLQQLLYSHNAGDTVTLIIYRNGRRYEVILALNEAQS
jgi:serine protease Do